MNNSISLATKLPQSLMKTESWSHKTLQTLFSVFAHVQSTSLPALRGGIKTIAVSKRFLKIELIRGRHVGVVLESSQDR
jgi:hypothetical protein